MAFLEIKNLKKIYTTRFGGNKVEALKDVSFSVEEGEYIAIMGPSGSGKSTLMNIIGCIDTPTSGEYYLDGENFVDKDATYDYLIEELNLPEYQGRNLDALWDTLSMYKDVEIRILNARSIQRNLGEYGTYLLDLFGELDRLKTLDVWMKW